MSYKHTEVQIEYFWINILKLYVRNLFDRLTQRMTLFSDLAKQQLCKKKICSGGWVFSPKSYDVKGARRNCN